MNVDFAPTPPKLRRLVEQFRLRRADYIAQSYNEAQLRKEYLDRFFALLGWDMDNSSGMSEAYKDVIHEDSIRVTESVKAPDYCFRSGGRRRFFVEAKKPSVKILQALSPAYQVRRYGWSALHAVSILTNFDEFVVYDCRYRPEQTDSPNVARLVTINFEEYDSRWSEIAGLFSKEAVLAGSLERYAARNRPTRKSISVDEAFLAEIDGWRKSLADNIGRRNQLSIETLNYVVQQTIDRVIFLRICEDRGIESYGSLHKLSEGTGVYQRLLDMYRRADKTYNSGLFHFYAESGRGTIPDTISTEVIIDDKQIKEIVRSLYFPRSPYEFSVISPDILGKVYEQFLGSVIAYDDKGAPRIDVKPEVRKAGGVYYTPTHIVNDVLSVSLDPLLHDRTPAEIAAIRIFDPACGSGSFLVDAYQHLLNWHLDHYVTNGPVKHAGGKSPKLFKRNKTEWALTISERKRILVNCIFGIDIDPQAVEVAKLSLCLKVLEGESQESIANQLKLFRSRALPDLEANIQCGNALVGTDFHAKYPDASAIETTHVNACDITRLFPTVAAEGGFDVIIGNPPWGASLNENERAYLSARYSGVPTKVKDSYLYFIVRALTLLKPKGKLGFILPNTWLLINSLSEFRRWLIVSGLTKITDYGDGVFANVIAESATLMLTKGVEQKQCHVVRIRDEHTTLNQHVEMNAWMSDEKCRFIIDVSVESERFLKALNAVSNLFSDHAKIIWGIKPYQVGYGKPAQTRAMINGRVYHSEKKLDASWKKLATGTHVDPYVLRPVVKSYIKYGPWLMYQSNETAMRGPKILMRQTSDTLRACYDESGVYCQNSVFVITSNTVDLRVLTALLNSSVLRSAYALRNPQRGKVFAEIKPSVIKALPIPLRAFNADDATVVRIADTVDRLRVDLLSLRTTMLPHQVTIIERRIAARIAKIDSDVCGLYGVSAADVPLIA